MLAKMVNYDLLLPLASSLLMLVLQPLFADAASVGGRIVAFARSAAQFLARDDTAVGFSVLDAYAAADPPLPLALRRQPRREPVELTCGDAAAVTARLGLPSWRCGGGGGGSTDRWSECRGCGAAEVVGELAGGGRASERELEEAFFVFDRGEDGFICAAELWAVMRRLGFVEAARYEDCQRMIRAFDDDGDGRISLPEFERMMESAA